MEELNRCIAENINLLEAKITKRLRYAIVGSIVLIKAPVGTKTVKPEAQCPQPDDRINDSQYAKRDIPILRFLLVQPNVPA